MRCENFGCKRNWPWLGFGLTKFGGLAFFALVAKLVNKWSYGFCAILVGNCHKCIKMRCEKFCCKRNWSWFGFGLAKFGWLAFFAVVEKLVNKWIYGFCAILVGNCLKCIKNEVWKVWLRKELILVGFWLSQVRWINFLCIGSKIGEKVKSLFLRNLGRELSQMYAKWGVKSLLAKGIDLVWVLVSHVGCIGLLWHASKISEKVKSWFLSNSCGKVS